MSPTHDFIDIGDVLKYEFLQGEIKTIDVSTDTCTVSVGGVVYSAIVFYHCEPNSTLRSNGAVQDGSTGFVVGDQVFVMKKKVDSPTLSEVKVVGHVNGCRHCLLGGEGYYIFYKNASDEFKVSRCIFGATSITVEDTIKFNDILLTQLPMETSPALTPLTWHIKKFRHNVMTNGTRTERDLYCVWSSVLYYSPYAGWNAFAAANPTNQLVVNNLNTNIVMTAQVLTDLQTVNYNVNHAHTYASDPAGNDNWRILGSGESGDCEDFALTKAQKLLDLGYPASALHIEASEIAPTVPPGTARIGGHAWLVVQTTTGDYALDINSDTVGLNKNLTFSGREFTTRRRQIGSNWAFISPFSAFNSAMNVYLGYTFVYILDPLLNILYPLPWTSAYRPFLFPEDGVTGIGSCSINFSDDHNSIYYADAGWLYTYRLDENVLTEVSKVANTSSGWLTKEGVIKSPFPAEPLPEDHPFWYMEFVGGYINPEYFSYQGAELISFDGYYDFQYEYRVEPLATLPGIQWQDNPNIGDP